MWRQHRKSFSPDGFCVWVCGDWRRGGEYKPFHSDCINMFTKSGLILHDIIVMKNDTIFAFTQVNVQVKDTLQRCMNTS